MNITNKLIKEHRLILKYIDLLLNYLEQLSKEESNDKRLEQLKNFVDFIQNYADKYHHAKEENILFKYMEEPGVLTHCNPLPVMMNDHQEGRNYVKHLLFAIKNNDKKIAVSNAYAWANLLRDHIGKEDNILYVMAEEGLTQNQKECIAKEYEKVEVAMNGINLEEKYLELYRNLESQLKNRE